MLTQLNYVILKILLQKRLNFEDVKQFDENLHNSLKNLLLNNIESDFDTYFEYSY